MARLFNDAATEYLTRADAIITGEPFSISAVFKTDDLTKGQCVISISKIAGNGTEQHALIFDGVGVKATGKLQAMSRAADFPGTPGNFESAISIASVQVDTYHHGLGVWASTSLRSIYLDGVKGTDNTNTGNPDSLARCWIGRLSDSTPNWEWSGALGEIAIWAAALVDAEAAALAAGVSPLLVRPSSLIAYWRLLRDEDTDIVGGFNMTPQNTPSVTSHPRIIYPAAPHIITAPAAAPAGGRIMSSLAAAGGLAGMGGIAGQGGGLAG